MSEKKAVLRQVLFRLNPNDPDDMKVLEMMNQRNGMTIGKFFVQAVLNNQNSTWRQSDWTQLRQIIREELENCPLSAGISVTAASVREPINKPPERAGKLSADALSFMQGMRKALMHANRKVERLEETSSE